MANVWASLKKPPLGALVTAGVTSLSSSVLGGASASTLRDERKLPIERESVCVCVGAVVEKKFKNELAHYMWPRGYSVTANARVLQITIELISLPRSPCCSRLPNFRGMF